MGTLKLDLDFGGLSLQEIGGEKASWKEEAISHMLQTVGSRMYEHFCIPLFMIIHLMANNSLDQRHKEKVRRPSSIDYGHATMCLNTVELNLTSFQNDLAAVVYRRNRDVASTVYCTKCQIGKSGK